MCLGCQDVAPLGGYVRLYVFRQGCVCVYVLFYVSLGCQNVSSLGNNLSRFRQGGSVCVCWCFVFDVSSLGRAGLVFSAHEHTRYILEGLAEIL